VLRENDDLGEGGIPPLLDRASDALGSPVGEMPGGDAAFLKGARRPSIQRGRPLRWVDLFAGCGAMSLGAAEAAFAAGRRGEVALSVDFSGPAVSVFRSNFPGADVRQEDVARMFSGREQVGLTDQERALLSVGPIDLLIGGPPCQGHSDLNNYSRRDDPRNRLYPYIARAAEVFAPRAVIVENVRGVPHDRTGVLAFTSDYLKDLGYAVTDGLIDVSRFGVAQKRIRHVLLATRSPIPDLSALLAPYVTEPRTVRWAIGDLADLRSDRLVDQPSKPSGDNVRRIAHLFEHDLFDLPDTERPKCHRDKPHSYRSVYGRIRWEDQAQTVTSGFYSMCMGRYVHPARQRTLTAHEAARLQFIPDSFSFDTVSSRTALAEMIGNAVPPKLSYVLVQALLKHGAL